MNLIHEYEDGILKIAVSGELGNHEAREMIAQMETITAVCPMGGVILDLSGMTFMDSSGLAVVLHLQRALRNAGRPLTVRGTKPQAMRVFQAAGLPKIIRFEEEA